LDKVHSKAVVTLLSMLAICVALKESKELTVRALPKALSAGADKD